MGQLTLGDSVEVLPLVRPKRDSPFYPSLVREVASERTLRGWGPRRVAGSARRATGGRRLEE